MNAELAISKILRSDTTLMAMVSSVEPLGSAQGLAGDLPRICYYNTDESPVTSKRGTTPATWGNVRLVGYGINYGDVISALLRCKAVLDGYSGNVTIGGEAYTVDKIEYFGRPNLNDWDEKNKQYKLEYEYIIYIKDN